jgi:hypothetical protein
MILALQFFVQDSEVRQKGTADLNIFAVHWSDSLIRPDGLLLVISHLFALAVFVRPDWSRWVAISNLPPICTQQFLLDQNPLPCSFNLRKEVGTRTGGSLERYEPYSKYP